VPSTNLPDAAVTISRWRKRTGIEPANQTLARRFIGFEDRGRHQSSTRFHRQDHTTERPRQAGGLEVRSRGMLFKRWRAVARVGELAPGQLAAVAVEGIELVLGKDGDRYFATQRTCVHRGADLSRGQVARGYLVCPQHGWRFSTTDGRVAAAMDQCLAMYPVRVKGEHIEIAVPWRWRRG
jgi:nitrite reductase (NADH) small subunit